MIPCLYLAAAGDERTGVICDAAARIKRDGHFTTKAGIVRRRLGWPGADPAQIARAQVELARGVGIGKAARLTGLGTGTVHKLKREMAIRPLS
jgi:hypothetical protein